MIVFTVKKYEKFKYGSLTNVYVKLSFDKINLKLGTIRFSHKF